MIHWAAYLHVDLGFIDCRWQEVQKLSHMAIQPTGILLEHISEIHCVTGADASLLQVHEWSLRMQALCLGLSS